MSGQHWQDPFKSMSPPVLEDRIVQLIFKSACCMLAVGFRVFRGRLRSVNPETLWLYGPEAETGFKAPTWLKMF